MHHEMSANGSSRPAGESPENGATPPPPDLTAAVEALRQALLADAMLLDAEALAALLGVSTSHLWRMRDAGRLPKPLRLGAQCLRWPLSEIRAWLAAGAPDTRRWEALRGRRPGG
jgi:predicted DNA-binding transcriptional regulator AlpA